MEKFHWMWVVVTRGGWLWCEGREGDTQKTCFRRGARNTFIISKTFARGRYSLIVFEVRVLVTVIYLTVFR